jgi:hypothetical protein
MWLSPNIKSINYHPAATLSAVWHWHEFFTFPNLAIPGSTYCWSLRLKRWREVVQEAAVEFGRHPCFLIVPALLPSFWLPLNCWLFLRNGSFSLYSCVRSRLRFTLSFRIWKRFWLVAALGCTDLLNCWRGWYRTCSNLLRFLPWWCGCFYLWSPSWWACYPNSGLNLRVCPRWGCTCCLQLGSISPIFLWPACSWPWFRICCIPIWCCLCCSCGFIWVTVVACITAGSGSSGPAWWTTPPPSVCHGSQLSCFTLWERAGEANCLRLSWVRVLWLSSRVASFIILSFMTSID